MQVVKNAVCTFCGCTCDDIELAVEGARIVKARHACSLGEAWFLHHTGERHLPAAVVDGTPADLDHAIHRAAQLLGEARYPLVYGLSNATCEAQREAVALAELLGGVVDSHTSI
jgi:formylmethanofuran dehydrogenase subunit B